LLNADSVSNTFDVRQVVRLRGEERAFATPEAADALRRAGERFDAAIFDRARVPR
jgi:hypothetical protein